MPIPKFPDFSISDSEIWNYQMDMPMLMIQTDTGRPKTPIFTMHITFNTNLSEQVKRDFAREELMSRYRRAHPNGCPGSHDS